MVSATAWGWRSTSFRRWPRQRRSLGVGHVVTVEPGVYIAGAFGVRIEDMVEVTADGPRVMAATPKDLLVL